MISKFIIVISWGNEISNYMISLNLLIQTYSISLFDNNKFPIAVFILILSDSVTLVNYLQECEILVSTYKAVYMLV